jgi:transcriptional regulator with XRE-family HTH domain
MSKNKSSIGENIRQYRLKKEMSQDRLSKLADVAFHTIVKIESGDTPNPTIETVRKIADALGVSIDDLMK